MSQILVVASQTVTDELLVAEVLRRSTQEPGCEFFLVVPQTPLSQQEQALRHSEHPLPFGETGAVALARRRLRNALHVFAPTRVVISGGIGDANPVKAVAAVLAVRKVDEIIVSTLPRRQSRWLASDVPRRLHRKFGLPVTHVETGAHLRGTSKIGATGRRRHSAAH